MNQSTPNFGNPPVIEVAVGVQFKEPLSLPITAYGSVADAFVADYPNVEEQDPLAAVVESFGDEPPTSPESVLRAAATPRAPVRVWFSDPATGGLIQVQSDRFVFNWRCVDGKEYPRYGWVRSGFDDGLQRFLKAVGHSGPAEQLVDMCEVTYVNHIVSGHGWENHGELHKVFPQLGFPRLASGKPEEADVRLRFAMEAESRPGRLHVRIFPAKRPSDGADLFVVNLIARDRPSNVAGDVMRALDDAHRWVVTSFKEMTSPDMHKVWGIKNA
jgi:uncharacterized protein (TIGR04255 family)